MQTFTSTVEERMRQEINVIAHEAEAELKPLRKRYIESVSARKAGSTKVPPPFYYLRRIEIVIFNAGNKMDAVEHHWTRRRT